MKDLRPGLNPQRLVRLMRDAVERCELDLSGKVILTEAATGAYVVTPVLAAMAGAERVFALTRDTRHGTVQQVRAETERIAHLAGVAHRIEITTQKTRDVVAQSDIITNSGCVRPIDNETVMWMKPTAVVPLMYEAWEIRAGDVDLAACRRRGIAVAGTSERHPAVDVFSFLGMMAIKMLTDAGVAVYRSRILLLCDNPFAPFIQHAVEAAGAAVDLCDNIDESVVHDVAYDAVLIAMTPRCQSVLSRTDVQTIRKWRPGVVVAQFWGDIDREALSQSEILVWPPEAPAYGHMGILPSDIGPEPIVRLQSGGLKVGEILSKGSSAVEPENLQFVQPI